MQVLAVFPAGCSRALALAWLLDVGLGLAVQVAIQTSWKVRLTSLSQEQGFFSRL